MSILSILFILIIIFLILVAVIKVFGTESTFNEKLEKVGGGPMSDYKTAKPSSLIRGTIVPSTDSEKNTDSEKYPKNLARRLTDAGWKLYIKQTCPWCHLQMDMFGDDRKYLNIVDCSENDLRPSDLSDCQQTWVYPTWANNTHILPGSQTFKELNKALKKKKSAMTRKEYQRLGEKTL
jgi:hypothetical protein